jgi:hypothetical protein
MTAITLSLPIIADSELAFDEAETREILLFFWPMESSSIERMVITNNVRRFAQALLIVAVDASYAIGFIDILINALLRRKPGSSITSLVRKVTKKYVKHWWKHATEDDLREAKIYDTVRATIALKQRTQYELFRNGLAATNRASSTLTLSRELSSNLTWA